MAPTLQQFLAHPASRHRAVVIGGLAVIAHGNSRETKDGDAWLDPMPSPQAWADALRETLRGFAGLTLWSLTERRVLDETEIEEAIRVDGVLRVQGLIADLDLFRKPTGLELEDFEEVWQQSTSWTGEVRVIDPINLILTKAGTGRPQDELDVFFLESKIRRELGQRLAVATPEEAAAIFARYVDHVVCERALANPSPEVQAQARALLRELAESGDWFARDVLTRVER